MTVYIYLLYVREPRHMLKLVATEKVVFSGGPIPPLPSGHPLAGEAQLVISRMMEVLHAFPQGMMNLSVEQLFHLTETRLGKFARAHIAQPKMAPDGTWSRGAVEIN